MTASFGCLRRQSWASWGEVARAHRADTSFINTWGDGIFAVFEDVRAAAEWALKAQERVKAIDLAEAGLPGICTCAWAGTWALCIR